MAEHDESYSPRTGARSGLKRELSFVLSVQAEFKRMGRTRSGKIRRFYLPEGHKEGSRGVGSSGDSERLVPGAGEDVVEIVDVGEVEKLLDLANSGEKGAPFSSNPVAEGELAMRSPAEQRGGFGSLEVSTSAFSREEEVFLEKVIAVDSQSELVEAPSPIDRRDGMNRDVMEVDGAIVTGMQNGLANSGESELVETVVPIDCRFDTMVESFSDNRNEQDAYASVSNLNNAVDGGGCNRVDLEDGVEMKMESATAADCLNEVKLDNESLIAVDGKSKPVVETVSDMHGWIGLKGESDVTVNAGNRPKASDVMAVDSRTNLKKEKIIDIGGSSELAEPRKSARRFTRSLLKCSESFVEVSSASSSNSHSLIENAIVFDDQKEVKVHDCTVSANAFIVKDQVAAMDSLVKPSRRFTRSFSKILDKENEGMPSVSKTEGLDDFELVEDPITNIGNDTRGPIRAAHKNLELKMSKKIVSTEVHSKVGELLATRLLDGLSVKYVNSCEKKEVVNGVINDGGILCFCSSCKGEKTVSASQFAVHAGGKGKHPANFIYLENGNSLRHVIKACMTAPLDTLESTIKNATHFNSKSPFSSCQQCKAPILSSGIRDSSSVCDVCSVDRPSPNNENASTVAAKKTSSANNFSLQKKSIQRKMTTKDFCLHKLVFMNNTLPDGTEVAYYTRGQRLLEGYIKGSGIFCRCCNSVVSPSQFEAHAGCAQRRKPYLNIYTSNGVSLHELSVSLSKDRTFSARENDDVCRICAGDGDLLLCDSCPRSFHKECVGLSTIPEGDWYCPCCKSMIEREKYVAHNDNAIAAGRVSGVDPIDQIFKRCIRIVQNPEIEASSCVLCRCHDFSKSGFGPRTVLLCDQCEKEFHIGCLKSHRIADLEELPEGEWFCCSDCSIIYIELQKFVISGEKQLPELLLDVIKSKGQEKGLSNDRDLDVRWQLLKGKMASADSRLLLDRAISIFQESFDPIIDMSTGQDLIPSMVYGKDIGHTDFGGVYCAILTVNSSVVSVGVLRVLGRDVAELPLVATTKESQGHGYFQALFSCVGTLLESLDVKHLVLPATKEAESIWVQKFGFHEITQSQLEECTKGSRPISFQRTVMLHKLVQGSDIVSSAKRKRRGR